MSVDYSILLDSKEPINIVKTQLEMITNSKFKLSENWGYYDLYYVAILGLWIQFRDWRESAKRYQNNEEYYVGDEEYSKFTYQIQVGYVRKITGLSEGKEWVRIATIELARMVSRNLKCNSVVERTDVITHRFSFDEDKLFET